MFLTHVDVGDVFEDGKPVINGKAAVTADRTDWWWDVPEGM